MVMTMTIMTTVTLAMTMTMMTVIGENQDDELKDEDSPLIELPSAPHHDFHLPGFHKPNKPIFLQYFQT